MCMVDYGDGPDAYTKKTRKARKSHKCSECGRTIHAGEQYEYVSGIWDGHVDTFKTCNGCLWAAEWLQEQCDGYCHGGLQEDLQEHVYDGYHDNMLLLRFRGVKRKWPDGYLEKCKAKEAARKTAKA